MMDPLLRPRYRIRLFVSFGTPTGLWHQPRSNIPPFGMLSQSRMTALGQEEA